MVPFETWLFIYGKVKLYRGVYPILFDVTSTDTVKINQELVAELTERSFVRDGERVIITKGDLRGRRGGTNNMKIVRAGDIIPDVDHFLE